MRKFLVIFVCTVLFLTACGKDDKNREEYEDIDHYREPTTTVEITTPNPTATPTMYISDDDIMNSFHREENIIEVEIDVVCAVAYSDPYSGKPLGYLVGECFTTEDFYWADHNNRVGFNLSCTKGLYETDENGVIHPVHVEDSDGIIWVRDNDAFFSLVPHPENYDGTDWGS